MTLHLEAWVKYRPRGGDLSYRFQIGSMFDMHTPDEHANEHCACLRGQIAGHIDASRQRIQKFVYDHYSWPGTISLNRSAWGTDVLVAPYNITMGFPNFLLRILAPVLDLFGAHQAAKRLVRSHFGLPTTVQKKLTAKLMRDLLDLPLSPVDATDPLRQRVAFAAREPIRIYVQTRNVAGDITAGTLAMIAGIVFFNQFTPGSISAGSVLAHVVANDQAVSDFAFGEVFGRLYYAVFPVSPSLTVIAMTLVPVMATVAVVAAFSGFIHDPIQALTGVHKRRLHRLLDVIEESINEPNSKGYRPKDTFLGRIYDLSDWIKGLLSF